MYTAVDGNFNFCAHPIIGGNEQRIGKTCRLEIENAAKAADFTICANTPRGAHSWADEVNQAIACINIYARLRVGQSHNCQPCFNTGPFLRANMISVV